MVLDRKSLRMRSAGPWEECGALERVIATSRELWQVQGQLLGAQGGVEPDRVQCRGGVPMVSLHSPAPPSSLPPEPAETDSAQAQ